MKKRLIGVLMILGWVAGLVLVAWAVAVKLPGMDGIYFFSGFILAVLVFPYGLNEIFVRAFDLIFFKKD